MNHRPSIGPVMLDLRGKSLLQEETELLSHPAAGGIILFSRNYESPQQLTDLIEAIRAARADLLIAVDHEGGRVQRFRSGFTHLPSADTYERVVPDSSLMDAVTTAGWLMAAELRSVDIDFSFAPVLDVDCGISEVIGNRSFSRDPLKAATLAAGFAHGMRSTGMAAVGKHFPGHGAVEADSHLTLPIDQRSYEAIDRNDLVPFRRLISERLEGIMPSHVIYAEMDDQPAGFSRFWIETVLRGRLGFCGAVFSDDLSMKAAESRGTWTERAQRALEAGCDMVLVCNNPDAAAAVLDGLSSRPTSNHPQRLEAMRGRFPIDRTELLSSAKWKAAQSRINLLKEQSLA